MIEKNELSDDPVKKEAAMKLKELLATTLEHKDHRWFNGKMDPAEKAARKKAAEDFKQRYK